MLLKHIYTQRHQIHSGPPDEVFMYQHTIPNCIYSDGHTLRTSNFFQNYKSHTQNSLFFPFSPHLEHRVRTSELKHLQGVLSVGFPKIIMVSEYQDTLSNHQLYALCMLFSTSQQRSQSNFDAQHHHATTTSHICLYLYSSL